MARQNTATNGLFLSPILEHFQKNPRTPFLFLSKLFGNINLMYVDVHIINNIIVNKLWKLNKANILVCFVSVLFLFDSPFELPVQDEWELILKFYKSWRRWMNKKIFLNNQDNQEIIKIK